MSGDLHPFQRAGLGFAPFRFVTMRRHAGGFCSYCGHLIGHNFICADVDGREFAVGSDCVAKVANITGQREDSAMVRDIKRAAKQAEREEWEQRRKAAWQAIQDNPALFTDKPHPQVWREGKTLRDDILYRFSGYSPQAERRKAIVAIERAIRAAPAAHS